MSIDSRRVSVVVPSFNHASYLAEALRSVEAQDYGNLELILVDDASSDGSVEVAREILDGDDFRARFGERVELVVNDTNLGAHAAINRGLERASGSILAILNSDDCYLPGRIRQLVDAMLDRESLLAFSGVDFMDESSKVLGTDHPEVFRLRAHQARAGRFPSLGFAAMCSNVALSTGNLVFSRELLETVGNFAALGYCHDWDFLVKSVAVTEPVFLPQPLYRYRLHGTNSFLDLGGVAEEETRLVLTGYFEGVQAGRVSNPLAPSPGNWPGVFEYVMTQQGFWRYW